MDDSPSGALEYIFTGRGVLEGTSRTFEVPVDGSVSRLLVSVEHDRDLEAMLFRPGGRAVTKADRDVRIAGVRQVDIGRTSVSGKTLFTVTPAEAGVWRLELALTGEQGSRNFPPGGLGYGWDRRLLRSDTIATSR